MKKKQEKAKSSVRQLTSLKGYVIFMALSGASLCWLFLANSWLAGVTLGVIWSRLYRSRQLILLVSCFLVSLLFASYCLWQQSLVNKGTSRGAEEVRAKLLVDPNSFDIDGDTLRFEGRLQSTGELVAASYRFPSPGAKEALMAQDRFFEIEADLELNLPVGQRNMFGFDYRRYLLQKGIYRQGLVGEIYGSQQRSNWRPTACIKVGRRRLWLYIDRTFPTVTASYMKSLILGVKDSAFKNQQAVWGNLSILHFFSISGMHVFFFVGAFRRGLLKLRLTHEQVFWLELLFLFGYLFLTGFSTSVGRSVFYLGLGSLNKHFKGRFSELDCWSGTLLISLLLNPYLLFQAAGQLSFGLSLYILYLKPLVKKLPAFLSQLVFSSVLSLLAVPLLSANFYEWHLLGLFLTFLLVPVFNYVLLPLLSSMLVLSPLLKSPRLFQLIEEGLRAFQRQMEVVSAIRGLNVVTGHLTAVLVLACLMLSLAWLHHYHQRPLARWVVLVLIICLPSLGKYTNFRGLIAFVDVGQGDCLFIQRPFHRGAILLDTGGQRGVAIQEEWRQKEHQRSQASYTLLPFLKSRGIKQVDQVIISHAHEDHFGDLKEVNRSFGVKAVYYPPGTGLQANFRQTLEALEGETETQTLRPGQHWQNRDYRIEVLFPLSVGDGGNDDSLVILLTIKDKRLLLTGDLERAGEQELLGAYPNLSADILKVGHHGSRTSSTEAFLAQVDAQTAVISCGRNNRFGHPHEEALTRLQQANLTIYRTDQQGMVYYNWVPWAKELSQIQTITQSH